MMWTRQQSEVVKISSMYTGAQPLCTLLISSSQSFVSSSASFFWKKGKILINAYDRFRWYTSCWIALCPPSGPGSSPATPPATAPVAAAPAERTSLPCSWPAPQRSLRWPWTCTVYISNSQHEASRPLPRTRNEFSLFNFLFSVHFEGLVALLLLLDPGQIVLSTSFQSLFVLGWKEEIKLQLKVL